MLAVTQLARCIGGFRSRLTSRVERKIKKFRRVFLFSPKVFPTSTHNNNELTHLKMCFHEGKGTIDTDAV